MKKSMPSKQDDKISREKRNRKTDATCKRIPQNPRVRGSCVSNMSRLPSDAVRRDRADDDDGADVAEDAMEATVEADTAADNSCTTVEKDAAAVAVSASLTKPPPFDLLNAAAAANARRRSSEKMASDVCERARAQKSATSDRDEAGNGAVADEAWSPDGTDDDRYGLPCDEADAAARAAGMAVTVSLVASRSPTRADAGRQKPSAF